MRRVFLGLALALSVVPAFQNLVLGQALAQREAKEMVYLSRQLISNYEETVNMICWQDMLSHETKELSEGSYTPGGSRQIFLNQQIVVEDDLNPTRHDSTNVEDKPIGLYLSGLDVTYGKRADMRGSIILTNGKLSNLKRGEFYYFNYSYVNTFANPSKADSIPYRASQRVMTIRLDKGPDGKWKPLIAGIRFARRSDTLRPNTNDAVILKDPNSAVASAVDQSMDVINNILQEEAKKDYEESRKARDREYTRYMHLGDSARDGDRYEDAIHFYTLALDLNAFSFTAKARIRDAEREVKKRQELEKKDLEVLLAMGEEAYQYSDFEAAKSCFERVLRKAPDSENIKQKLNDTELRLLKLNKTRNQAKTLDIKDAIKLYNKEIDAAQKAGNKALAIDLTVGRAQVYSLDKDFKRAKRDFAEVLAFNKNHRPGLLAHADMSMKAGEPYAALNDFTQIIGSSKYSSKFYTERGLVRLVLKDTAGALADYDQAIGLNPQDADLYYQRGIIYQAFRRYSNVVDDLTKAITLFNKEPKYFYQRGMGYLGSDNLEAAGRDFRKAEQLGLESSMRENIKTVAQFRVNTGIMKLEKANLADAVRYFADATRLYPALPEAHFLRGTALMRMREYQPASEAFDAALAVGEYYKDAMVAKARALSAIGRHEPALAECRRALKMDPLYDQAYIVMGEANANQGSKVEAEAAFKKAIEVSPNSHAPYFAFGQYLSRQGQHSKAEKALEQAGKKGNVKASVEAALAQNDIRAGEYKSALKHAEASLKTGTALPEAYLAKGMAMQRLGQSQQAAPALEQVVEKDLYYEYPQARVELARAYASYESYNKALGILETLGLKDPKYRNADYYLVLGYCHYFRDDLTTAQENFQLVLDKDAANGMGLFGLACIYLKKKDEGNALTFFEKAFQTKTISEDDAKEDKRVKAFASDKRYKALIKQYL